MDIGYGYDSEDSFVDDSEAVCNWIIIYICDLSARNNSRPLAIFRPISAFGRPKSILIGHISHTFSMGQQCNSL